MRPSLRTLLVAMLFLLSSTTVHADEPTATPTPSGPRFTPADVINVVNQLRIANGLPALRTHPALMQVAQTEASGIAQGYGGHWRPEGLTLGQWLLSLGYPLSGDLSMDGYRAENWFTADLSSSLEDVTAFWQGDAEHRETMFSAERSDIGAGMAVDEDGQVYVVLETALQTSSGKMQYDAYPILTGIPQTQQADIAMATLAAESGQLPQYMVRVAVSTAGPDGNIYHEVQYGQSLWAIAIAYHTTIKDIQTLNGLSGTGIRVGQKLLVRKGAAQPARTARPTSPPDAPLVMAWTAAPEPTEPLAEPKKASTAAQRRANVTAIAAVGIAGLVLAGVFVAMMRKKQS